MWLWVIRIGMYLISGVTIWHFVQNPSLPGSGISGHLALDQLNGMVFGVCSGISNYTGIDVSVLRLGVALSALYRGLGIIIYILAFLILPIS